MSDSESSFEPQADPPRNKRRLASRVLLGAVGLLLAFTGWLAWQAQGLEERILREVQPHLAVDVHVEGLEVSLWSAWPNVEVRLEGVRIADALNADLDFMRMERVDLTVACLPLLQDRLEVRALTLSQGEVRVVRGAQGQSNWTFWKASESDVSGLDAWGVDRLALEGVLCTGEWSTADAEPVRWRTRVNEAALRLTADASAALDVAGSVKMEDLDLDAAGQTWLNGVHLATEMEADVVSDRVDVVLQGAILSRAESLARLECRLLSEGGRFGLHVSSDKASWSSVDALLPPALRADLKPVLEPVDGEGDLEVWVDRGAFGPGAGGWRGPSDAAWTGAWAARMELTGTRVRYAGQQAVLSGGQCVAYDVGTQWRVRAEGIQAAMAGGELALSGEVEGGASGWTAGLDGRGIFRPAPLLAWSDGAVAWPEGWSLSEGGQVETEGRLELRSATGGELTWRVLSGASVRAKEILLTDGQMECGADAVDLRWEEGPWQVSAQGVHVPGCRGDVVLRSNVGGGGRMELDLASLDAAPMGPWLEAWTKMDVSGKGADPGVWDVLIDCGPLQAGRLKADRMGVRGMWSQGRFRVDDFQADALGGRIEAKGEVSAARADLDGRMSAIDLPSFLEATDGLGQSTLLPRHVRGTTWAEGHVGYAFGRQEGLPWDADLTLRIEEGELIDFALLQEIPATLAADRKYRWLADVEDVRRRLQRVRFEPLTAEVELERDVITLAPVTVNSDAMDVGVGGWYRMGGNMDFTLDFALRDLKSDERELGTVEEDGLGHRFFLAIGGTLEEPEFGYDRAAHQAHRQEQRQGAWSRLRDVISGEGSEQDTPSDRIIPPPTLQVDTILSPSNPPPKPQRSGQTGWDDDDDF